MWRLNVGNEGEGGIKKVCVGGVTQLVAKGDGVIEYSRAHRN